MHQVQSDFVANHAFSVYPAAEFRVTNGVNHGDAVGGLDQICLGDGYSLKRSAKIFAMDLAETAATASSSTRTVQGAGEFAPVVIAALIAAEDAPREIPLADLTGMSFGRGTRITMSDGSQRPVEHVRAGDRVLTRDKGMQEVRWVGTRTVQGAGEFAPVVIAGAVPVPRRRHRRARFRARAAGKQGRGEPAEADRTAVAPSETF